MSPTELIGIAIGWALLALGAASLGASALRRQHPARLLLTFGIWCALYGTRLIAAQPALRALLGGSPRLWLYVVAFITYGINVPTAFFFEALSGGQKKGWIRSNLSVRQIFDESSDGDSDFGWGVLLQVMYARHRDLLLAGPCVTEVASWSDQHGARISSDEQLWDRAPSEPGTVVIHGRHNICRLAINRQLTRPGQHRKA